MARVTDNEARSRFELTDDDGTVMGYMDYERDGDQYAIPHTKIDRRFEGRGLGHQLVSAALEEIAQRGGTVLPYCPFVPRVMSGSPELIALVPENRRAAFGL
jgi:predicted GNAT family acetyltransferase